MDLPVRFFKTTLSFRLNLFVNTVNLFKLTVLVGHNRGGGRRTGIRGGGAGTGVKGVGAGEEDAGDGTREGGVGNVSGRGVIPKFVVFY